MAIFNSYVKLPKGKTPLFNFFEKQVCKCAMKHRNYIICTPDDSRSSRHSNLPAWALCTRYPRTWRTDKQTQLKSMELAENHGLRL